MKVEALGASSSYSEVLRCMDRISGQEYAMKVVDKVRRHSALACAMEAHCLRRLEFSPWIISMLWDLDAPSHWVAILELCPFGNLWTRVQCHGCVAAGESAWFASQMVESLSVIHAAGIVHRDLRCEHFVVGSGMKLKLIDFGTARDVYHPEVEPVNMALTDEARIGAANFMSPEVASGGACDKKSDLYSLGCCIYQLVTGAIPFSEPTLASTIQRVRSGDLWLPERGLHPHELDLIQQLTRFDPELRLGGAGDGQTRRVLYHPLLRSPASRPAAGVVDAL